jgi:hypothetical protein|tara:strand:+ start:98 stop:295 length:198 start_codon:yes stop_codon:yes gene_type:complete
MPTNDMARFIGGVSVIPVSGRKQVRILAGSLPYRDRDIRNLRNVSYVDSKHRIKHNWMCCLWIVI